jgi:NAD(P)-dependent dehydrogenase (short-subunit alcohol dehydrogenase family)
MTSIAIIGAGRGLGAAAARRFGAEGFSVALQVSQLVIPGAIVAGDPEKDPAVLAGHLWDLHTRRDRFRHTVRGS